jgi:hypothetical protein
MAVLPSWFHVYTGSTTPVRDTLIFWVLIALAPFLVAAEDSHHAARIAGGAGWVSGNNSARIDAE